MKFCIPSKILLSHMASVGKAINPKIPIPILCNFLLELDGDTLVITGTDQEIIMTTRVEVTQAEGKGKLCLDAARVLSILKATPDSLVSFDINDETLSVVIRYTNGKYEVTAIPGDDYPVNGNIEESDTVARFDMPSAQIADCLDKVAFAAGTDDFHPQMMGVLWDVREDAITLVATDTRQLAKYRSTRTRPGVECSFIMPTRAVQMIGSVIGKDAAVRVTLNANSVHLDGGTFSIKSVLVNGRYPNYERVIPRANDKTVIVDRVTLLNAVKRVIICADSQFSMLKVSLSAKEMSITSQDLSWSMGASESVPCEYDGPDMLIGFSGTYLCGILDALKSSGARIRIKDPSSAALFLPSEDDEFGEHTLLCMPVSTQKVTG